jgi:hypothetical protein
LKTRIAIVLLVVFIFQLICFLYWIPFSSLKEDTPLLNDDYPFHYSQIVSVINFSKEDGKMWGYNPFLLAGYPAPVFFGLDQMAWELFVYILSFLPLGVSFKLYVALLLVLFPFLCYFSGRNFGIKEKECVIALIFGILIFYIPTIYEYKYPIVSGAAMVSYGMIGYVFLCYLSLYVLSIFYSFLENSRKRHIILLFIFAPLLCLTHALAPLLLGIPILIMLFLYSGKLRKKNYLVLTLLCIWTVMINSYWIIPLFKFLVYKESTAAATVWTSKDLYLPYQFYIKNLLSQDIFYTSVLLFGLMGLYFLYREGKLKIAIPLVGQTVFLFSLCFYGSFSPFVENLHPHRFILPLHLFLIFPCAITIHRIVAKPILGILFVLLFAFYLSNPVNTFLVKGLFLEDYYLLKTEIPKRVNELSGWVIKNTTSEERILLEDTKSQMHHPPPYLNSHFASLLPIYTKREFLVGPIPTPRENPYMTHTFSTFRQGELFWRDLDSFSIEEIKSYFDLYNINWIICWSKISRNFFKRYPDYLKFTKRIDGFYIYKVFRSPSFFFKGEGDIVSAYNRLFLKNIKPQDNEIVIKYHWMKYLKTEPELKMERVMLLDDPVGFIKIKNPPSSLVIYNAY